MTKTSAKFVLPYLTAEVRGVGGAIKQFDEDFVVEEIPRYQPNGTGTHVYFFIEKRGLPTLAAIQHIARALGRQPRDIGYAGMKDAHGVTRQMLSVEHIDPSRVESLSLARIKVLWISRHANKLKLGHLAGNRFDIKVRETMDAPLAAASAIVKTLERRGVPNYFGPQRFGARGDNALIGAAVLRDDYDEAIGLMLGRPGPLDRGDALKARELFERGDYGAAADAWPRGTFSQQSRMCRAMLNNGGNTRKTWKAVDHTLRKLYLSAFQSELFNQVLARRIESNLFDRLLVGDIAYKHANGACFLVEDAEVEQARCESLDISPTGPLFGRRMTEATGEPGTVEEEIFVSSGLDRDSLAGRDSGRLDGSRRPMRVPVGHAEVAANEDQRGPYLRLQFSLPAGAYATSVLREVCKAD